ncbi:MAG: hypothetical protein IH968_05325 [Gemmatimonadetes bacterium]|nr:hypothetical protein [Gemmatimonadota bacterium]
MAMLVGEVVDASEIRAVSAVNLPAGAGARHRGRGARCARFVPWLTLGFRDSLAGA